MRSVLFSRDATRSRVLAAPLTAGGYSPEIRIVGDAPSDADVAAARGVTIVFIDLAMGTAMAVELCGRISATVEIVLPLLAILGEPTADTVDVLIAAGANMYLPDVPESLALRVRFLRSAMAGRAVFAKTLVELRESEERNRRLELEHRTLLDCAPDAVFVHRDGRIVWANHHGAALLGMDSAREAIGEPVTESSRAVIEESIGARTDTTPFELTVRRRDGREAHLWIMAMPIVFEGQPARIAICRDLTAQRELEMQLVASERLASLGRLAASVGHEINNPLTYVLGNVQLALGSLRKGSVTPEVLDRLEIAMAGAEQVRRIVDDLRVFSQRDDDSPMPVDVRAVVESCIRMTSGELRHRAQIVQAIEDGPTVLASEPRLAQVVTNLLLNAAQAIPDGAVGSHTITISARLEGSQVVLRIEDTGEGIAAEHLSHVFEPFFTTKAHRGRTGLGLSVCKMLVASQGGELAIESELGRGTCVTVRLPALTTPARAPVVADVPLQRTPRRVLLVDDDAMIVEVLRDCLQPHDITIAMSGRAALARLHAGDSFDVIVCDLMMPDLSGIDVLERIRVEYPEIESRIVFMTAGAFTPRAASFLASVKNTCLGKPFPIETLLDAIDRVASPASSRRA